jgi:hypothetical protein
VVVQTANKVCPALTPAIQVINALPATYPKNWTIVVVCTQGEWEFLQRKDDAQKTNRAFTKRSKRRTRRRDLTSKLSSSGFERGFYETQA